MSACERCIFTKEKLCDTGHCGACDFEATDGHPSGRDFTTKGDKEP